MVAKDRKGVEMMNLMIHTCSKPNRTSHKCDVKNEEDEIEFKWGVTPDLNCFFAHFEPILISI